jgi:hypothetical protein
MLDQDRCVLRFRCGGFSERLGGAIRKTGRSIRIGSALEACDRVKVTRGQDHEVSCGLGRTAQCLKEMLDEERVWRSRVQGGFRMCEALARGGCPDGRA